MCQAKRRKGIGGGKRPSVPAALSYGKWEADIERSAVPVSRRLANEIGGSSYNLKPVVYLAFSRGEVAERPNAAVC